MFIDESGFMLQPVRRKTWASRGNTPIHKAWDRHDRLSVISALTVSPQRHRLGLYFQIYHQNIRTPQVVDFLRHLHRHLPRRKTVVWDRWNVHRSAAKKILESHPSWFDFEWLPAYAPELNPVEYVWNRTKSHELANYIPEDIVTLEIEVDLAIAIRHTDQKFIHSCFEYAKLTL